ncbi:hypothetical protein TDB9533_00505 [Thalassocella blandensis]|nr:hypothetical protein TDB9533_00505 [Thalassocella blandensis]
MVEKFPNHKIMSTLYLYHHGLFCSLCPLSSCFYYKYLILKGGEKGSNPPAELPVYPTPSDS